MPWARVELERPEQVDEEQKINYKLRNHPPPGFEPRTSHSTVCRLTMYAIFDVVGVNGLNSLSMSYGTRVKYQKLVI